ncbi:MAG: hypothetical protein ACI9FU_000923 [Granulosicoccus sp.]|jgi:hypothetical protein
MEYNSARERLMIPEYGRNIQKMIEYAGTLETKEDRTEAALSIIRVMGQVNPLTKEDDSPQKLWDHMFIISGYSLDVESPYPMPSPEKLSAKPDPMEYPSSKMAYRHYGRVIQRMAKDVGAETDEEKRKVQSLGLANLMKRSYLSWNRSTVADQVILKDMKDMSEGKLDLPDDTVLGTAQELQPLVAEQPQARTSNNKKRRKSNTNNNNKKRRPPQQRGN